MKNKESINKKLIDILLKKAAGFHYQEEQYEYEKDKSKKDKNSDYENLNFFNLYDRGENKNSDDGVNIKLEDQKIRQGQNEGLILVKKKVTSHYIPPDMLAIKILLEIFGKEAVGDLEGLSDEELIKFKEKIMKELKDEIDC